MAVSDSVARESDRVIWAEGRPAARLKTGILGLRRRTGYLTVRVGSGRYDFTVA